MDLRIQKDCANIDWNEVSQLMQSVNIGSHPPEIRQKAFANSAAVVFVFAEEKLIGLGRAVSDCTYEAAIYDIAVHPEYQGKGIGKTIVETLMESLPTCSFILYAAPGKEGFYAKLGFRRLKTGMGLFRKKEYMRERGFTD